MLPGNGIILAMTWGIFHFVSRGVGIEIWNGTEDGYIVIFLLLWAICYKSEYKEALWIIQVEKHMEKAKK